MTVEHIRFAPAILRRLGEELIPAPEQGILELVRNAYDADASACSITLDSVQSPGGALHIVDDGDGMDLLGISLGWLVIGQSSKESRRRSHRRRRRQVGEKGLGRLAALRLGRRVTLRSRPRSERGVEYIVELDWDQFDNAEVVEDVAIPVTEGITTEKHGIDISIEDLRTELSASTVERLARALVLLADPFGDPLGFAPVLRSPEYATIVKLVARPLRDFSDYFLHAELDKAGHGSAVIRDWRKRVIFKATHDDLIRASGKIERSLLNGNEHDDASVFKAPPAEFDLWMFLLRKESFSVRQVKKGDLQEWLRAVGGVHLYDRGLRVGPYGDPGHDWLEMNLSRVRSPEERPSTNNSVGRIVVVDTENELIQKTDRSGFIETPAFAGLRRFAHATLEWMADVRLRAREHDRNTVLTRAPKDASRALKSLEKAVLQATPAVRKEAATALKRLVQAQAQERRALEIELELYRTLGTIGTTVAVFAHESARPVQNLTSAASLLESAGRKALAGKYDSVLGKHVEFVRKATNSLRTFSNLPLRLLARDKRKLGVVDINTTIADLFVLFDPHLRSHGIRVEPNPSVADPKIYGTRTAAESIFANLLTNAIAALLDPLTKGERVLRWSTEVVSERVLVTFGDSGPGIRGIELADIWLPGRTTREIGTGLGLTIARDAARDLQGRVTVISRGDLGGAEFTVDLPQWLPGED